MQASAPTPSPQQLCEEVLREIKANHIEKQILPGEVIVINRLLSRGLELQDAYSELHDKLSDHHHHAIPIFFDVLLGVAVFWSPEGSVEAREERARLIEVNEQIHTLAAKLADLLAERTQLQNHSGFSCDTVYHPIKVMHEASKNNYSYGSWVKKKLDALTSQFDLKYWPPLEDFVRVIGEDAARAEPTPHDPVTAAWTDGARAGLSDTFKAFFTALDEQRSRNFGFLPDSLDLTDRTVASLLSCALDLGPDDTVGADFVKRLRQRERQRARPQD